MSIKVGDRLPDVSLKRVGPNGIEDVQTASLFAGRRVILVTLLGAYTPDCAEKHLPGYVANADQIRDGGIDEIFAVAVNDAFVMKAWGESQGVADKLTLLADGNGDLARALGIDLDLNVAGMGVRFTRGSMVLDDGVVQELNLEPGRDVTVSSAEHCLATLE